ncbi:MAG: hypothetical protein JSR90_13230 [Proteobacteria bacterium]|nr:hypothetical protein [Pseudomonadota bacterium]
MFAGMKPDHYRWQDFVIPPKRTLADLMATAAVIVLSVSAVVSSGGAEHQSLPPDGRMAEMATPSPARPPTLAVSAKRLPTPSLTENCL